MTTMNWTSLLAIGGGAVLGAWLRYGLGLWLNPVFVAVPMGTLAANLIGGYLVGAAVMVFHINAEMPPELKLFAGMALGYRDEAAAIDDGDAVGVTDRREPVRDD